MMDKPKTFRDLHYGDRPLILPNAWDYGSAALLVAEGFPAIGTTSLGVAVAAGLADGQAATRDETLALATRLARLPVPVTVDIEGGFSDDPAEVAELVAVLGKLGIAGVNLEDGRAESTLADPNRHAETIAAVKAQTPEVFLNARVDAYWLGIEKDSALERAVSYAEAGADGVFVPGVREVSVISAIVDSVGVPVNILYSAEGPSVSRLGALGVRRVSTGSLLYRAAVASAVDVACAVTEGASVSAIDIPDYQTIRRLV